VARATGRIDESDGREPELVYRRLERALEDELLDEIGRL